MLSLPDFLQDASRGVDPDTPHHDLLELRPLNLPPSPGRGRGPSARLDSHHRAFSYSPQPRYTGEHAPSLLPRDSHSDLGFLTGTSRFNEPQADRYLPEQTANAMEEYLDASLMAVQYLDLPTHCTNTTQEQFNHSYPLSDSSASSPEATDSASSSSPRADIFSAHSSPAYHMNDLPDAINTPRPHSGYGRNAPPLHYPGPHGHHNHVDTRYQDSLILPRPAAYHDSHSHSANSWGYPPALPFISQSSRYPSSRPPSPEASHLLNSLGQYPVPDDLRRWPQMFKINQVKKVGPKKQLMACLFCRERKIGCSRPPEDDPDQTCNQCARRKRKCEYPTESRRGQHTRNRLNSKKFLGLEEPKITPVTPPTLPKTE
ncbi:hypothetical protein C8R43DRAFT_198739 [Mycena crocata]|nr:hypothetical protein C8R43DRAFT_198739 [Mycena crocata]